MPKVITKLKNRPERTGESFSAQLRSFHAEKFNVSGDIDVKVMWEITCPRCSNQFWVGRRWPRASEYKTRPCPYCFKTSLLPKRSR